MAVLWLLSLLELLLLLWVPCLAVHWVFPVLAPLLPGLLRLKAERWLQDAPPGVPVERPEQAVQPLEAQCLVAQWVYPVLPPVLPGLLPWVAER